MTIKTDIRKSRTGLYAVIFEFPYPETNLTFFVGGYLSESAAKVAADRFAWAIGRTVERVQP
mgnify:CR=1 FL=1